MKRLVLEMTDETMARIEALGRLNETLSEAETVRRAVVLYNYVLRRIADEDAVLLMRLPGGTEEVLTVE